MSVPPHDSMSNLVAPFNSPPRPVAGGNWVFVPSSLDERKDEPTPAALGSASLGSPPVLSVMTHAVGYPGRDRGKKGRKLRKGDVHSAFGNDELLPGMNKHLPLRGQQVTVQSLVAPSTWITSSAVAPVYQAAYFTAGALNDFSSFAACFDQYRIDMIEAWIEPSVTEVTAPGSAVGNLVSVVDIDSADTPSAIADLCSYATAVVSTGSRGHYHKWVPTFAIATYAGAFTSYGSSDPAWVDCGSPSIQHYGLKAGTTTSTVAQAYSLTYRLTVSFRTLH